MTLPEEKGREQSLEEQVLRITAALYRVTELCSDEEPLKWMMRSDAIMLMNSIEYKENISLLNDQIASTIRSIRSKLAVAQVGGFISRINYSILDKEYTRIAGEFIKDTFDMSDRYTSSILDIPIGHDFFVKDKSVFIANKKDTAYSPEPDRKNAEKSPSSTIERQEKLLGLLKKVEWASLRDISLLYADKTTSDKTIQRDLIDLVKQGKIRYKGEKRWRRYNVSQ